jgi:PAS domain-containing protein
MIKRRQLIDIDVLDAMPEAKFDQIVEMAAGILGSQVSLFSVIDEAEDRQFFKSATGLPAPVAEQRQTPLSHSFCKTVVSEFAVINVSDAREDPRFQNHPAIESLGVISYLGAPVIAGEFGPIGALCAINNTPRTWSARDEQNIAILASTISEIISHRLTIQREVDAIREAREVNERFSDIAESIPGAVFRYTLRPDGTDAVDYMSSGCRGIWEVSPEEIQNDAAKLWECIVAGDAAGMEASINRSARTLELWQHRWSIVPASGRRKALQGYGMPNRKPDGSIVWNSVIIEVTTEVMAQERVREQEAMLSELQKQEAIGQIAAGVAHDFNNLLFIIMGSAELLAEDLTDEDQLATINAILDAATRGSEMTSSLLAFARKADLRPENIDANLVISHLHSAFASAA